MRVKIASVTSATHASSFPSFLLYPSPPPGPPLLFSPSSLTPLRLESLPRCYRGHSASACGIVHTFQIKILFCTFFGQNILRTTAVDPARFCWFSLLTSHILLFWLYLFVVVIIFTCSLILLYFIWRPSLRPSNPRFDPSDLCGSRASAAPL
jgi:hypothetical protein